MVGRGLIELKNKYVGKKVAFLGSGSSLLDFDLGKLDDDIMCFSFNRFIPFCFDFWENLRLDFFMAHDYTVLQSSFYNQFMNRKNLSRDEKYEIDNDIVKKYKDTITSDFALSDERMKDTKIIISDDIHNPHATRFGLLQNSEWIEKNEELLGARSFYTYKIKKKTPNDVFLNISHVNSEDINIDTWAKNSFCNSALPLMLYMGFSEIYLFGVDYSDKGYFFCESKGAEGYKPRETSDFNRLMTFAETLPHKPKIYSVKTDKVNIVAKDGFIDFSEIST